MDPEPDEGDSGRDARFILGSIALFLFWVSAAVGGFFFGIGWGFLALSGASLVVSYLLGSSE